MPKYKLLQTYQLHPGYMLPVGAIMQCSAADAQPLIAQGILVSAPDDSANKIDPQLYDGPCWPKHNYSLAPTAETATLRPPAETVKKAPAPEKREE